MNGAARRQPCAGGAQLLGVGCCARPDQLLLTSSLRICAGRTMMRRASRRLIRLCRLHSTSPPPQGAQEPRRTAVVDRGRVGLRGRRGSLAFESLAAHCHARAPARERRRTGTATGPARIPVPARRGRPIARRRWMISSFCCVVSSLWSTPARPSDCAPPPQPHVQRRADGRRTSGRRAHRAGASRASWGERGRGGAGARGRGGGALTAFSMLAGSWWVESHQKSAGTCACPRAPQSPRGASAATRLCPQRTKPAGTRRGLPPSPRAAARARPRAARGPARPRGRRCLPHPRAPRAARGARRHQSTAQTPPATRSAAPRARAPASAPPRR